MDEALVGAAVALHERLQDAAPQTEAARRVPAELATEFAAAGFFRMLVPDVLGGLEVHPRTFVRVLEALGRGDGAAGWIAMTGSTTGLLSAYLPTSGAKALFTDPARIYAGVFAPMGRAIPAPGGFRLSGRWPFTSGVENSHLRMGGALVMEGDAPRLLPSGEPEIRSLFVTESSVVDTWKTSGLRGTGSHDMVVEDVFVPAEHTCCVLVDAPQHDGRLYRFPLFGLLAAGIAAVGLGIARNALDAFEELAALKKRGRRSLAESELTQVSLARATGDWRAARSLLDSALDAAWDAPEVDLDARASIRLAATHAAHASARVVDTVYHLGGGGSIYEQSRLQRCFRDVHTMTQHIMVSEPTLTTIGRVLMDLPVRASQL